MSPMTRATADSMRVRGDGDGVVAGLGITRDPFDAENTEVSRASRKSASATVRTSEKDST
jgi:hypothetical protein